jgi:hypothetical protein
MVVFLQLRSAAAETSYGDIDDVDAVEDEDDDDAGALWWWWWSPANCLPKPVLQLQGRSAFSLAGRY